MAKKKTPNITHYVYDSGSGVVSQSLMREMAEHFEKISEHPEMQCFDLRNHLIYLSLYEVPKELLERLKKVRLKGDMAFREFIQKDDGMPTEVPEDPVDPEGGKTPKRKRKLSEQIVFPKNRAEAKRAFERLEKMRAKVKSKVRVSDIARGAPVS